MGAPVDYMAEDNYFRDLRMSLQGGRDDVQVGVLQATPDVRTDRGTVDLGALFALIDGVTGRLATLATQSGVVVTSDLNLHVLTPPRAESLTARARVLRAGGRAVTIDFDVAEGEDGAQVAVGEAAFVALQNPEPASSARSAGPQFKPGPSRDRPIRERCGMRTVDAHNGVIEAPIDGYTRNHIGALHGAMVVSLLEMAAEQIARATTGHAHHTASLFVRFLDLGRRGPARTRAEILRDAGGQVSVRVQLRDAGERDRLIAVASATTLCDLAR